MIATTQAPPRTHTQRIYGALPSTWVAGINFENTTIPSGMVTFMNYDTTASAFFIKHAQFELKHAGESAPLAKFSGQVDITAPELSQTIQSMHIILRDPDVAHGMTSLVETDVQAAFGGNPTLGGLIAFGFSDSSPPTAVRLVGVGGATPDIDSDSIIILEAWKKSGTTRTAIAAIDFAFAVSAGLNDFMLTCQGNRVNIEKGLSVQTVTPAQITGTTNDWNPFSGNEAVIVRADSNGSNNVTGMAGGYDGRVVIVTHIGSANQINFTHESIGSAAANRFSLAAGATTSIFIRDSIAFWYDGTAQRWRDWSLKT